MVRRSPFGELVYAYRTRLGFSQGALATEITRLARGGDAGVDSTISERIISLHEAARESPATWTVPRAGTVKVYADIFRLSDGSAERLALFAAAEQSRRLKAAAGKPVDRPVAPARSADFVVNGRELPWARLRAALDDMLKGEPRVLFLQGEAGIGKTRLLQELGRLAEHVNDRLMVAWSHCAETGAAGTAASPYHAPRELLALLTGDIQSAGAGQLLSPATGTRLRQRAPQTFATLLETGPWLIGPLLDIARARAQAASLGLTTELWRARLDAAIGTRPAGSTSPGTIHEQAARTLHEIAAQGPLVIVIDDLHWATPETIQLLTAVLHVLQAGAPVPCLVLSAYRPPALATTNGDGPHPLTTLVRETQRIWGDIVVDLRSTVAARHGRAYIDGRVDLMPNRLDSAFRARLFRQTGGLPIFVENALRALTDGGQLRLDGDVMVLSGRIDEIEMPATSRAIIGRRLDDLPDRQRTALEIGAVQGETFFAEPVARILGLDDDAFAELFDDHLVNRQQLLVPGGSITIAGQRLHRYQFAHELYRDYLLATLGPIRREQYLTATARALAAIAGGRLTELAARAADLYEQAGLAADAATQHKIAGDFELEELSPTTATEHFRRAIALADRRTQAVLVGHAMIGIGHGLRKLGHYKDAILECKQALSYGTALGSSLLESNATVFLGLLHYDLGELTVAERHFMRALPVMRQIGDDREECRAEGLLAHVLFSQGRYDDAIAHADRSLVLATGLGEDALAAESRLAAANCLSDMGLSREAIVRYQDAIELYRRGHDRRGEAVCLGNIGLCQINLGQWAHALETIGQARETADRLAIVRLIPHLLLYQGLAREGQGELAAAENAYRTALLLRLKYEQYGFAMDALAGLLRVSIATGRTWRARRIAWGIGRWLETRGVEGIEEPFRVAASCVAALDALGEPAAAERMARGAVALLEERAARIISPDYRDTYLHALPFHRALLARAAAVG